MVSSRHFPALFSLIILALAVSAPATLSAQGGSATVAAAAPKDESPEVVGRRYAAAMRAGDWPGAAAMMHPEALRKFRALMMPIAEADTSGEVAQTFFQVPSAAQVAQLSDAEVFARMFGFLMGNSPELKEAMGGAEMAMLGHVAEGTDLAHVVFRMKMSVQGFTVEKVETMSMQRDGRTWRVLLSGDIEGLAAALRARSGT